MSSSDERDDYARLSIEGDDQYFIAFEALAGDNIEEVQDCWRGIEGWNRESIRTAFRRCNLPVPTDEQFTIAIVIARLRN